MLRKFLCSAVISAMVLVPFGQVAMAAEAVKAGVSISADINSASVTLNGKTLEFDIINYDGVLYVPLRDACNYFNSDLQVDPVNKIINILVGKKSAESGSTASGKKLQKGASSIDVVVNPYFIKADGIDTYLDSVIYNDQCYVPIRYLAETFDKKVEWNSSERKAVISDYPEISIGSVNGETVTQKDFDLFYNQSVKQAEKAGQTINEEQAKQLKTQIFDSLVNRKVLKQKATQYKLKIEEADIEPVNGAIKQMVEGSGGIKNLRKTMAEYGTYFNEVVSVYYKEAYIQYKLTQYISKDVAPTEEKIKEYYDKNLESFKKPDMVRAKHILVLTSDPTTGQPLDAAKKEEVKKKAEDILSKIKAGEDFDKLMKENSQDPGLQSNPDGYTFGKGEMVPEFETSAFSLKVGEVSGLVETSYGFHILKLEEKIPAKQSTLEEVKPQIVNQLSQEEKKTVVESTIKKWKEESKVENNMK